MVVVVTLEILTIDRKIDSLEYGAAVAGDIEVIKSSVFSSDVPDGQRSGLVVQLQCASESPISSIKCSEDPKAHFCYDRVSMFTPPNYHIISVYFRNTRL